MARKRKFIVYVATSADGFIARTDGSVDWLDRPRPKGNYGMGTFYRSIDTCVLGRKTYEQSARFGMAEGYSGKKNYVLSRTLTKAASRKVTIINDNVVAIAERLRAESGRHVWLVGGAEPGNTRLRGFTIPRPSRPGRTGRAELSPGAPVRECIA
jgi:dihydrofolate reductase